MGQCFSSDDVDYVQVNLDAMEQFEREKERIANEQMERDKAALREKALPTLTARMSYEDIDIDLSQLRESTDQPIIDQYQEYHASATQERVDAAAELRRKKKHNRRKAKLDAEADERWMVFRDLDAFDEADMVNVARFMESVLKISHTLAPHGEIGADLSAKSNNSNNSSDKKVMSDLNENDGVPKTDSEESSITSDVDQKAPDAVEEAVHQKLRQVSSDVPSHDFSELTLNVDTSDTNDNGSNTMMENLQLARNSLEIPETPSPTETASSSVSNSPDRTRAKKERSFSDGDMSASGRGLLDLDSKDKIAELLKEGKVLIAPSTAFNKSTNRSPARNTYKGQEAPHKDSQPKSSESNKKTFDLHNFHIPSGPVTSTVAKSVIDVYKQGGRLCMDAVHKLLRVCYRNFQKLPNTTEMTLGQEDRLTIVGDIHGQLLDLMYILDHSGLPSSHNKYIFNGDFVDRGPCGVEVMCIIMVLYLAHPHDVVLNRGNHEDFAICCVYGFQNECIEKYDEVTFGMFVEVFNHLPLFALVNKNIFVLHGGLFHNTDVTMKDLECIKRTQFSLKDAPEGDVEAEARSHQDEFLKQLQRDALWSDPSTELGLAKSRRGAGVQFGPDVTKQFCDRNDIKLIVRSHECCRTGFDLPYIHIDGIEEEERNRICTIFSASNYGGGGNSAAYMVFTHKSRTHGKTEAESFDSEELNNSATPSTWASQSTSQVPVHGTDLVYKVHYFHIDTLEHQHIEQLLASCADDEEDSDDDDGSVSSSASLSGDFSIHELILRKKKLLLNAFRIMDPNGCGIITEDVWAECMQKTLHLHINWKSMATAIVDEQCYKDPQEMIDMGFPLPVDQGALMDYEQFLDQFSLSLRTRQGSNDSDDDEVQDDKEKGVTGSLVNSLYAHHNELLGVFRFFDRKKDNVISQQEFREGCRIIRQMQNSTEEEIDEDFDAHCDALLDVMNLNGSGAIDINEFFEMFRVSEAMKRKKESLPTPNLRRMSMQAAAPNISLFK